jgi:hypothetical protein
LRGCIAAVTNSYQRRGGGALSSGAKYSFRETRRRSAFGCGGVPGGRWPVKSLSTAPRCRSGRAWIASKAVSASVSPSLAQSMSGATC